MHRTSTTFLSLSLVPLYWYSSREISLVGLTVQGGGGQWVAMHLLCTVNFVHTQSEQIGCARSSSLKSQLKLKQLALTSPHLPSLTYSIPLLFLTTLPSLPTAMSLAVSIITFPVPRPPLPSPIPRPLRPKVPQTHTSYLVLYHR